MHGTEMKEMRHQDAKRKLKREVRGYPCRLFSKETFLERLGPVRGFVALKPKPFKVRQKKSPSEFGYRPQTGDPEPYTLNPEP